MPISSPVGKVVASGLFLVLMGWALLPRKSGMRWTTVVIGATVITALAGAAGQFLDELLAGIGLDRRTVFITNVVRHRPPENRDPLPEEISACHVWLLRHLEVLKPRVIVTLGRHAMGKFFPGESISRIHGKPRKTADGLLIFPVYHPAAALHQPALRDALHADFAALALFLATTPPTKEPDEKPVEQITLFG